MRQKKRHNTYRGKRQYLQQNSFSSKTKQDRRKWNESVCVCVCVCVFCLFRAMPVAYGSSWARGWIRATAASLHHSHSNARSKLHLQPRCSLRPCRSFNPLSEAGIEPASSWILVRFLTYWATTETPWASSWKGNRDKKINQAWYSARGTGFPCYVVPNLITSSSPGSPEVHFSPTSLSPLAIHLEIRVTTMLRTGI